MEKYKSAYKQLSASDKSAMDIEYATNRKAGKLIFNSKVTGLDYTIPENAGRKSTTSDKAAGDYNPRDYNPLMQDKIAPFSLNDPNRKFPQPAKPVIAPDRLSEITNIYNATQTPQAKEEMAAVQKTESKAPEVARGKDRPKSYVGTLNNIFGSTAIARGVSEYGNIAADKLLGSLDKSIGTNMNDREMFGQTMDEKSLGKSSKSLLYKIAHEKFKATGKTEGSIDYPDYERALSKEDYHALMDAKGLNGSKVKQAALSLNSPGVDVALTIGGGHYKVDPATGMVKITDTYDFLNSDNVVKGSLNEDWAKSSKMQGDRKANFETHDAFTKYDLAREKRSGLDNRKGEYNLTPQDTVGRSDKDKEASWLAKIFNKASVKPVKKK